MKYTDHRFDFFARHGRNVRHRDADALHFIIVQVLQYVGRRLLTELEQQNRSSFGTRTLTHRWLPSSLQLAPRVADLSARSSACRGVAVHMVSVVWAAAAAERSVMPR